MLYSRYLSNFANYQASYGALGAVVGLMMWLWLGIIVILIGGELNAAIAPGGKVRSKNSCIRGHNAATSLTLAEGLRVVLVRCIMPVRNPVPLPAIMTLVPA